jgi:2-C-methyl-D-erythritol 4-phosphate cytidylyltransferase
MKLGLVLVCAGRGKRLKRDKPVLPIAGKPLFYHAYSAFKDIKAIEQIVIVMRHEHIKKSARLIDDARVWYVEGGEFRRDSVLNGLYALDKKITHVLIHDGARPLVTKMVIGNVISGLKTYNAVICAVKARDTLKRVKGQLVKETVKREDIVGVQTPQGFKKDLILKAYEKSGREDFYDDAQLVERMGGKVLVVEGSTRNIKITYPEDIKFAKTLL